MSAATESAAELTGRLVAIDSVNPSLVPGGAGETEIAAFVAGWASEAGLTCELLESAPGRPTVLVTARGSASGAARTLLLCGHIDTVGVARMREPFSGRRDGDRLHGRGAYDMKGGVAAALVACRDAAALGLAGNVVVAAVADEEHASLGVQEALRAVRADAAIVTEPTELAVATAHKGFVWAQIEVTGRAAHGSRPHLGVDAIVKTGPILIALGALDRSLGAREHPLLGRASVHASLIEGGAEPSSYPARCVLALERRTLPGETAEDVQAELTALIRGCAKDDPEFDAEVRMGLVRDPFEVSVDAEIVDLVTAAAKRVSGVAPAIGGVSYWADAAFIAAAGIPTVLYGPVGDGAHASEEWVSAASLDTVAATLLETARVFCA